jgi:hypothetical protein
MSRTSRFRSILPIVASLLLASGVARAASPTTAECLAASESATSLSNEHKLRAERAELLVCAEASCPAAVRRECLRLVDDVNKGIPTIIISAKGPSGADLTAVKVTMDHDVLSEVLDGTALAIDPGIHTFTFEAGGQRPVTRNLVIREAEKDRRELVTFEALPAKPRSEAAVQANVANVRGQAPAPTPPAPPTPVPVHKGGTQRVLAIAAAGVAVVGIGVGTAFGLIAMSKKNDAQSLCPDRCATQDGVSKWSDAAVAGNVSTVAFAAGGVALVAAGVLWFTAPRTASGTSARLGVGPGRLEVQGSW